MSKNKNISSKYICEQYLNGVPTTKLGKELGVSPQAIMYHLKYNGIKLRPVGTPRIGYKIAEGYRHIFAKDHPMANSAGYVPEHRMVMFNHIGRILDRDEHVHHINHNKLDNRIENLKVLSKSQHMSLHARKYIKDSPISILIKETGRKICSSCERFLETKYFKIVTKKPFFSGSCRNCFNANRMRKYHNSKH